MSAALTADLLAAVTASGLVDAGPLAELEAWVRRAAADPTALVKEIRRRGLLTDFQIREVARGRGADLTLGPYRLTDLLGEGGMGRVFRATHTRLGREVALKVIRKEKLAKPAVVQRFHQEIRAAAQLSHPNVVLAFDADQAGGVHYYAMELVDGTDLAQVVRDGGPVPPDRACDYARQAALGLQHAHDRGLVHRDVKPSNLLLTPRGQVKLTDLGLAMLNDAPPADGRVTQDGLILGTPDFVAPEQAQNPVGVDIRADLYALGATLYYLVTGKVPYDVPTATDKLVAHITAPPPSVTAVNPALSAELDAVVRWLMAKNPADRPQTPAQAAYALAGVAAGGVPGGHRGGSPPSPVPPPDPPVGGRHAGLTPRHPPGKKAVAGRLAVTAAGIAGLAALAAAGLAAVRVGPAGGARPLPESFANPAGVRLVRLDGGTFTRGAAAGDPGAAPADGPPVEATVAGPFFMAVTEVTNGQFRQVMGRSPAQWPARLRNPADVPADSVTWDEAVAFCRKLTAADPGVRAGWAYRLPTEAEWEYACRAGTRTPFSSGDKLVYGAGGVFDLRAEPADGALGEADVTKRKMERGTPYPAPASAPNPFGLTDLHGNVWEWTADVFTPDLAAPAPAPPPPGAFRTVRGGSWREPAAGCRSAARRGLAPDARRDDVGFRVVLASGG